MYFEDRLARDGKHAQYVALLVKFQKSAQNRYDEDVLYEGLCDLGLTGEEADEVVNLQVDEECY